MGILIAIGAVALVFGYLADKDQSTLFVGGVILLIPVLTNVLGMSFPHWLTDFYAIIWMGVLFGMLYGMPAPILKHKTR